jgi:hypothetical protein
MNYSCITKDKITETLVDMVTTPIIAVTVVIVIACSPLICVYLSIKNTFCKNSYTSKVSPIPEYNCYTKRFEY